MDKFKLTIFVFFALITTGINEFMGKMARIEGLLSPFILLLAILIFLAGAKRGYFHVVSNKYSLVIVRVIISFLIFGSLASLRHNAIGDILLACRFYLPSLLVYFSFIIGFYHLWRKYSFEYLIQLLRVLLSLNVYLTIVIFLAPGLSDQLSDQILGALGDDRLAGLVGNANESGFSAVLLFCLEFYALRKKLSSSLLIISQISAILIFLIIGFSRTPIIMILVVTFLFLMPKLQLRSIVSSIRYLLVITGALLGVFFIFIDEISAVMETQKVRVEQIQNLLNGEFSAETTGDRSELAEKGMEMVKREPFWGNGLMQLKSEVVETSGVHNQYIFIWGEAGIIPLIFYLFYFIFVWRFSGKLEYELKMLVRSLIACMMIYSLVSHSLFYSKTMFLVFAFFAIIFIIQQRAVPNMRIENRPLYRKGRDLQMGEVKNI